MTDIYKVIRTASDQHVRTLLRLLCDDNYNTKSKAQQLHQTVLRLQSADDGDGSSGSNSRKRTREVEVLYCLKCNDCYIEEENHNKACAYHPGEFEPDYDDFFADHEEDIHGKIDDEDMFKECPEGYFMTCCQKRGDAPGCDVGRHASGGSQKAKLDANGEDEDEEDEDEEEEYDEEDEEGGEGEGEEDEDEDEEGEDE
ncbi:hypothetical protein AA313_de0201951 [Arthrobotrys entomopaga]|nr:hypothetical protein AA313_de0201951 [Arthrobotrys entomopaga]